MNRWLLCAACQRAEVKGKPQILQPLDAGVRVSRMLSDVHHC